jgi:hypothetical protein
MRVAAYDLFAADIRTTRMSLHKYALFLYPCAATTFANTNKRPAVCEVVLTVYRRERRSRERLRRSRERLRRRSRDRDRLRSPRSPRSNLGGSQPYCLCGWASLVIYKPLSGSHYLKTLILWLETMTMRQVGCRKQLCLLRPCQAAIRARIPGIARHATDTQAQGLIVMIALSCIPS